MLFQWRHVAAFFFVIGLVGFALYPNDFFLGQMHHSQPDRSVAIEHFKNFLKRRPNNRGAALALAKAYESIAQPEKAVAVLKDLYAYRRGDWTIGRALLRQLDFAGRLEEATAFRWRLFEDVEKRPDADRYRLESLLYRYYQDVIVSQNAEAELRALRALRRVSRDPDAYFWELLHLHMAYRRYPDMSAMLRERLKRKADDPETLIALVDTYMAAKQSPRAVAVLGDVLKRHPSDVDLLEKRIAVLASLRRYDELLPDARRLSELKPGIVRYRDDLAWYTLQAGRYEEAVALYREELKRRPKDRQVWMNLVDALEAAEKR